MGSFEVLDNNERIKQLDKEGMLEVVFGTPELMLQAMELSQKVKIKKAKKIKQIVVAGLGGSAISGNIVSDLLIQNTKLPVIVNRDYQLPAFVSKETLFISISYSGNTEETLKALDEAARRSAQIVCITSGGKLKAIAQKNKYPLFLIPSGYQPRAALPFLLIPLLVYLAKVGVITGIE